MFKRLRELLFGCWHTACSFPQEPRPGEPRPPAARPTGMYVVCLECGKEFPYDWRLMRVLPSIDPQPSHPDEVRDARLAADRAREPRPSLLRFPRR